MSEDVTIIDDFIAIFLLGLSFLTPITIFFLGSGLFSKVTFTLYLTPILSGFLVVLTMYILFSPPGFLMDLKGGLPENNSRREKLKNSRDTSINQYRELPIVSSDIFSISELWEVFSISIPFCLTFLVGQLAISRDITLTVLLSISGIMYIISFVVFALVVKRIFSKPSGRYIYDYGDKFIVYKHNSVKEISKDTLEIVEIGRFGVVLDNDGERICLWVLNPDRMRDSIMASKI